MKSIDLKTILLSGSLLAGTFAYSTMGYAQEAPVATDEDEVIEIVEEGIEKDDKKDNIIVTGSRIKRDTFNSISPLQVIMAEQEIKAGLIDPAQILQQSEAASGTQIDATFQGFVLNNGPGSQTLNLRGLDANRTLVLVNGRRLAPSGVEGAPVNASINQIPGSLVQSYELLLEGASSVYGSDAVAGVANVILRKDFDGFEVLGNGSYQEQGGNTDYTVSANWGANNDRGFIGIGAEYDFRDEVRLFDKDFLSGCDRNVEITEDGEIRNQNIRNTVQYDVWFGGFQSAPSLQSPLGECKASGITNRLFETSGNFGSIYYTGGAGNIGIPGFIDQTLFSVPIDANGDGQQDFGFNEFSTNGTVDRSFISQQKRASLMAYGEYVLEGDMNITPYFEALYVDSSTFADSGQPQLFPTVGPNNPFNPCGVNGTDCGAGIGTVVTDPGFVTRWGQYYADADPNRDGSNSDQRICARFGIPASVCTPAIFGIGATTVGPISVLPVVGVSGDRDNVRTTQKNLRLITGIKGDLPQLNFGTLSNWTFDTTLSYSRSKGFSNRRGIRDDRLNFALGNDLASGNPNGQAPCTAAPGQVVRPDVLAGCVPVNLFAPSLIGVTSGDFATAAERNYLFDDRTFDTTYSQTIWTGFITGNLMELPAGSLAAVFGAEYRLDSINSDPSEVARDGLFFGFFSDSGAVGKKATRELFGELDIPIMADKKFFKLLTANVSGRITDDEFYGTNYTYSVKGGWRPFDSLLLKASFGTSFRAPNLRENFLLGQSGFITVADPCTVPVNARSTDFGGNETYDATSDLRDADTLARCVRESLDPTSLGLNTGNNGIVNLEISSSGSFDLTPETSESFNTGFSFTQPFTDAFDLDVSLNYYRIDVLDGIIEPSGQFLINDCFLGNQPVANRSVFCDRLERGGDGFLNFIRAGFANVARDFVSGFDFNTRFGKDFNAFDRPMDFSLDLRVNNIQQRFNVNLDDDGVGVQTDFEGRFGFPEWSGRLRADLTLEDKWNLSWTTRYIGAVAQNPAGVDDFGDALGTSGTFSDTCGGAFVGDVLCRDVGFADDYFLHSASVSYAADTWRIVVGVSNVFDKAPPEVDSSEVFSISNVPIGNGYDLFGRRFFVNARKSF
jgi:iron complex outermembrane recepter protein